MKLFSRLSAKLLVLVMIIAACFGLTACEDIKTLEVKVSVYRTTESDYKEYVLPVDLYRHLAPRTVDAVIAAAEEGYYNDTIIYRIDLHNAFASLRSMRMRAFLIYLPFSTCLK